MVICDITELSWNIVLDFTLLSAPSDASSRSTSLRFTGSETTVSNHFSDFPKQYCRKLHLFVEGVTSFEIVFYADEWLWHPSREEYNVRV